MENVLSQINVDQLSIKLTDEKLYINTATSNETFALRSINGIGVIDLVDEYNAALTEFKKKRNGPLVLLVVGIIFTIEGYWLNVFGLTVAGLLMTLIGFFAYQGFNSKKPTLMSAVRVMMSGGNRDFKFDKANVTSGYIADFVAKVESTLSAYHKKNV
ncbi:MAG: hypothetical protein RL516_171 [Bacteroidota bacterium]|jgi:hypothetical protein